MKQLIFILAPVLLATLSCQKKDSGTPQNGTPQFQVDKTSITLTSYSVVKDTFTITSDVSWTISVSPSNATWVQLSTTSGSGNGKIVVTALEKNATASPRTATLTITPSTTAVQPLSISVTQITDITWSKLFGGTGLEETNSLAATADGGFVIAGMTGSNEGDVSGNHGGFDAWVLKLDAGGNKQWAKVFGGTGDDKVQSIITTGDGGFVMTGTSASNDGDLSGNHGSNDAWVLKLDGSGNKQWSKLFGGSGSDLANSIIATADGGFVVAGVTASNNGDVNGNHGLNDGWVLKLDASGNKQWSKVFGGTADDYVYSLVTTADGGFMLAGETASNNGDVSGNHGGLDQWVLKLDATGTKQWSKVYGGSETEFGRSIVKTTDGGFILAGYTLSFNGDVSGYHGDGDAWIQKLDASGNKQWNKTFGGTRYDYANSIAATADGGFILAGGTFSNDGDLSGHHDASYSDAWVLKLDGSGNKQWSKALGGAISDAATSILITADGGFVMAGTAASTNGDVSGNHGSNDAWVLKARL